MTQLAGEPHSMMHCLRNQLASHDYFPKL